MNGTVPASSAPQMIDKMTVTPGKWQEVIDVHLTGSFLLMQVPPVKHRYERSGAAKGRQAARSSTSLSEAG